MCSNSHNGHWVHEALIARKARQWPTMVLSLLLSAELYADVTDSMNEMEAPQEKSAGDHNSYWLDTKEIVTFRRWLDKNPALLQTIQQFAQFRVVVDANVVAQDLIHKVKFPDRGNTALQELIQSSVLEVHAPRWLEQDLASAIPQIAKQQDLSEQRLWDSWPWYREALKWNEELCDAPASAEIDPKDVPYVVLQKTIGAVGILSHDRHIKKMGGNPLTFEFIMTMRKYARASVVDVGIRVSGVMLGTIAIGVIQALFSAISTGISRLPSWLKIALVIAAVVAVLHPRTRIWIAEQWRSFSPAALNVWTEFAPTLVKFGKMVQAKRIEAEAHLENALRSVPCADQTA